jgi:hypothetical protein
MADKRQAPICSDVSEKGRRKATGLQLAFNNRRPPEGTQTPGPAGGLKTEQAASEGRRQHPKLSNLSPRLRVRCEGRSDSVDDLACRLGCLWRSALGTRIVKRAFARSTPYAAWRRTCAGSITSTASHVAKSSSLAAPHARVSKAECGFAALPARLHGNDRPEARPGANSALVASRADSAQSSVFCA